MNITELTDLLKTNIDGLDDLVFTSDDEAFPWMIVSNGTDGYLCNSSNTCKILTAHVTPDNRLCVLTNDNVPGYCSYLKMFKKQRVYL